ncbi:MAG: RHS repeat-associated core domain-containing protein [Chloroflexota bacterium]
MHSRQGYYPYGETRYTAGELPTDFHFTGQRNDATIGLYDYHARWYDPTTGRFLTRDPVLGVASLPRLSVQDGDLLADDEPVTQWSYALFQVLRLAARTRDLGVGQPWYAKLIEAESIAEDVENDPSVDGETRKERWQACSKLLGEARTLIQADPSYLPQEKVNIIRAAFNNCRRQILGDPERTPWIVEQTGHPALRWNDATRELLDVDNEVELSRSVSDYAQQVYRSRQVLRQAGLGS